jgi:hypothetical protein
MFSPVELLSVKSGAISAAKTVLLHNTKAPTASFLTNENIDINSSLKQLYP